MQHFDIPDPHKMIKAATVLVLALLAFLIMVLALSANPTDPQVTPPPHGSTVPASVTTNDNSTERSVHLTDGRTVLCLSFPERQVSCDWAHAERGTR